MSALYPLLVIPEFRERVWGTRDLRPYFQRVAEKEPIGEVWLTGDECRVANGPLKGSSLGELCQRFGAEFTGTITPQPSRFPLLIKFLFPRQRLSIQVHPDDEGAKCAGQTCGKTECWYVARALPGAQVGLGLRAGIDRQMFRMAVEASQAEHMLNWGEVRAGDMIYVDAGTVHAIGPDSILVETQQNCDITYRLYDYGRPRELHLEKGVAAIREKTHAGWVVPQTKDAQELLLDCRCFRVEKFKVQEPLTLAGAAECGSPQVLVCMEGGAVVECAGAPPVSFMRGDAVVIPASLAEVTVRPQWSAEILRMSLPAGEVAEPATNLHTDKTNVQCS